MHLTAALYLLPHQSVFCNRLSVVDRHSGGDEHTDPARLLLARIRTVSVRVEIHIGTAVEEGALDTAAFSLVKNSRPAANNADQKFCAYERTYKYVRVLQLKVKLRLIIFLTLAV